jgi:hypothetical protein
MTTVEPPDGGGGMNMAGIHMVEVEGMDLVEERPSNHWPEDEGMDMVEERPSKERPEAESMDMEDIDMIKDMTVKVEVVEREHESVVLVWHWIDDGAERHRRTHWKWEELLGCSEGHNTFTSPDSNYSTLHIVEKSEEESWNVMKYVWNEFKPYEGIYRVGDGIWIFWIFLDFLEL